MDPAETEDLKQTLADQVAITSHHESSLRQNRDQLQWLSDGGTRLSAQLAALNTQLATPTSIAAPPPTADRITSSAPLAREPFVPIPVRYSGGLGTCSEFLHRCSLVFSQQPATFSTSQSRVAFMMSLLTRQAADWTLAISTQSELMKDYHLFSEAMKSI